MFINHPLTKIPKNLKRENVAVVGISITTSLVFDSCAFFMQLGKQQIIVGNTIIGLLLITLYYIKDVLRSAISACVDTVYTDYREHYQMTVNNTVIDLLLKVRGKVWRINEQTHSRELMSTNSILLSSQNYLSTLWGFKTNLPKVIFQGLSAIVMFIGFVMVTTVEIEHVYAFISIIIIVSIFSVAFSAKRMQISNRFRVSRKDYNERREIAVNDAINIEPINSSHALFMTNKFIEVTKTIFGFDRNDRQSTNKVDLLESTIKSLATISIIAIKVYESGLSNVNLDTILSLVSLLAIYSQIMNKIYSLVRLVESSKRELDKLSPYETDFIEILRVFDQESDTLNIDVPNGTIQNINVPPFLVQYQSVGSETPFSLVNESHFEFNPGDIVLLTGPTGSGKSTFMKMLTRKINFETFEVAFSRKSNGPINTLMHQTDGRLGNNFVLEEIVLGKDVDEAKLLHILKGLHLYEEISEKSPDVIDYLKTSKVENFSTGQKQRLTIARLLYNLDESVQIIGFDEATNALNDEITLQTLSFIKEYCPNKILFIATHQVNIGKTVANRILQFAPTEGQYCVTEI